MLKALDKTVQRIPRQPQNDVEQEIENIRLARQGGGRRA
jgi:hypothetical protein